MTPRSVVGGIGDILLMMEDIVLADSINLYTHQDDAVDFLKSWDVKIDNLYLYSHPSEISRFPKAADVIQPVSFPICSLPPRRDLITCMESDDVWPLIGIHPFGSNLSSDVLSNRGLPAKSFPHRTIDALLSATDARYHRLIFGSPAELDSIQYIINRHPNCTPCRLRLVDALYTVPNLDILIATDSCFKTMGAIRGVTTVCMVGDHPDPVRDMRFFKPYMQEHLSYFVPLKYSSYEEQHEILMKVCEQFGSLAPRYISIRRALSKHLHIVQ